MQPTVIVNQHRNTAIIVTSSGSKLLIIKLSTRKLVVSVLTIDEIKAQGYVATDYSPQQAARSYLEHGAGVSLKAKKFLEEIASKPLSGQLDFSSIDRK